MNWRQRIAKKVFSDFLSLIIFCSLAEPVLALDPNLPPSGNFDLSHWKLQMPVDSNGTNIGNAAEISAAQLAAGFTNSFFHTAPDGAMAFWTPNDGATTSGSTHPRSELRELLNPANANVNWTVYGSHILTAQCKVTQVPADTGKVCIGQIHEPNTKPDGSASANNEHLIMFDLPNQKIYANINLDGNLASTFSQTFITGAGVALNSNLNYTMSVSNGVLKISVNNVTNSWNLLSGTNYLGHIAQNWDRASSNTMYFKAGDYNQTTNACGCWTDGARVSFYSLTTYHAPSITNQPTNLTMNAGSTAVFKVGAVGNTTLTYQWWQNTTNKLVGATNSILNLANIANPNAGNYSVVINDNYGSITSAVAALTVIVPPFISGSTIASQNFQLQFSGTPQINYLVQMKTNLTDALWRTVATSLTDAGGFSVFTETNFKVFPSRFYRLSSP